MPDPRRPPSGQSLTHDALDLIGVIAAFVAYIVPIWRSGAYLGSNSIPARVEKALRLARKGALGICIAL